VAASAVGWRAADGASWYEPVAPPGELGAALVTGWTMRAGGRLSLVPDGCVEVLWIDNGTAWLCGPETAAWSFELPPGTGAVGLRFRPGWAGGVFGLTVGEVRNRRVALADVLGARAARYLVEEVGGSAEPDRLAALARYGRGWLAGAREPDPVTATISAMLAVHPGTPVAALAEATGRGGRQLHRRCVAAFGYGPATLRRILRLQRFLALARDPRRRVGLAGLAVAAGYTDQPHLSRDCRNIAGVSPAELAGRGRELLTGDVRSVHDRRPTGPPGWAA
jgi:AraC-like DNA-binding protein